MRLTKKEAMQMIANAENGGRQAEILEAYVTRCEYIGFENRVAADCITRGKRVKEVKFVRVETATDYKTKKAVQHYANGPKIINNSVDDTLREYLKDTDILVIYHGADIDHIEKEYYYGFDAMFTFLKGAARCQDDRKYHNCFKLSFGYKTETKGKNQRIENFAKHGIEY